MKPERVRRRQRLAAVFAQEQFVGIVRLQVQFQRIRHGERLVAQRTPVRPLTGVTAHVHVKPILSLVRLGANVALESFLVAMDECLVLSQRLQRGEQTAAVGALPTLVLVLTDFLSDSLLLPCSLLHSFARPSFVALVVIAEQSVGTLRVLVIVGLACEVGVRIGHVTAVVGHHVTNEIGVTTGALLQLGQDVFLDTVSRQRG